MRSLNGSLLCLCFVVAACSSSSNGGGDATGGAGGDAAGGDGGGGGDSGGKGGSGSGGSSASGGSGAGGSSQGGSGGAGGAAGGKGGAAGGGPGGAGGIAAGGTAGGMAGAGGVAPVAGTSGTGVFVAVGDAAVVLRSTDLGMTWQAALNIPESRTLDNLAFGNGKFFGGTHTPGVIFYSTDGLAWTKSPTDLGQWVGGVAFGNNLYVAAGGYGSAWYSSDAVTWKSATGRVENPASRSVAFGGGKFTAQTDPGFQWWTTTDGKDWALDMATSNHTDHVVYCGDFFKDGKNCAMPAGKGVSSVQGGGVWVAVVNGAIQRSADNGATWQLIAGTNKSLKAVAFGPKP